MRIKITALGLRSKLSSLQISAKTQAKTLSAKVSGLALAVEAQSLGLVAKAVLGKFIDVVSLTHTVGLGDALSILLSSSLTDTASASDQAKLSSSKVASDQAGISEGTVSLFGKSAADSTSITELNTLLLDKALSDAPGLTDDQAFEIEKALADTIYATDDVDGEASIEDDQEIHFIKRRTDRAFFADVLVRVVSFFREFLEEPGVSDLAKLTVTKTIADTVYLSDSVVTQKEIRDNYGDVGGISESLALKALKELSEAPGLTEAHVLNLTKALADTASLSEAHELDLTKILADSSALTEAHALSATKPVSDSSGVAESASLEPQLSKSDSSSVADVVVPLFGKNPGDQFSFSEDHQFDITKGLADTVYATDDVDGEASIDDDQELHFIKNRTDLGFISESAVKLPGKGLTDASSVGESGEYRGQGYCAFDYFEEDYVGYSGSF